MSLMRLCKIILCLLPILLFGGLFWRYVSPSGERVVRYEMGDVSPFVQRLLPDSRVSKLMSTTHGNAVTLLDEPVYFSVTPPPGNFTQVKVEVAFDPGGTPTFEIGGLENVAAQAFDFQPLSNDLLEHLGWSRHDLTDVAIFSRDSNSQAYQTILETPPNRSMVAVYRADFPTPFRLSNYQPLGAMQKFDVSLRGPHELLTYIKHEDFGLFLTYTDVNRSFGADEGSIRVLDENGNLMTEYVIRDDGNIYDNQYPSDKKTVSLSGQNWPEGVYRIVLSGTSDIMWRSMLTPQRYLVVKNRVFIGDDVGYLAAPRATTVYTNADRVTAETQHTEGLQTVKVGSLGLEVSEVGGKYSTAVYGTGITPVTSPVGDVKLTGEGKYAFSEQAFFDPDPVSVTAFSDLEHSQVNYVIAKLAPVEFENSWRVASGVFETSALALENGAYKFALSAPGLHDNLGQVSVHAVTVTFQKEPMTFTEMLLAFRHVLKLLLP